MPLAFRTPQTSSSAPPILTGARRSDVMSAIAVTLSRSMPDKGVDMGRASKRSDFAWHPLIGTASGCRHPPPRLATPRHSPVKTAS
jgi:hypothetical protein